MPSVSPRWLATVQARLFSACPVATLELAAGARDEREYEEIAGHMSALRQRP